jgi:hypothetical protein
LAENQFEAEVEAAQAVEEAAQAVELEAETESEAKLYSFC